MPIEHPEVDEWFSLLKDMGNENLEEYRDQEMWDIQVLSPAHCFYAHVLARVRAEYLQNDAYLATRIALLDKYYALPWYRRIFTRPQFPNS